MGIFSGGRMNPAVRMAAKAAVDQEGQPTARVQNALLKAVEVQRPLVLANLRRLRRKYPDYNSTELAARLERDYLTAVTTAGAAAGASAVVPGVGTIASFGLSAAATAGFLEATALYAQSMAELHGVHTEDPERSRTLVMAIMLGEEGRTLLQQFSGQASGRSAGTAAGWGTALASGMPQGTVGLIGRQIRKRFIRRFVAQQGAGMLGRAIPFGVGAVVGGAGNRMLGRKVVETTRSAFGDLPEVLPGELAIETEPGR
jgi:hypothetical protein